MDSGNIGFVLLCAAFVFVMTPGLAMFYGGLVRKKNVVNTMMTSIFIIGVGIGILCVPDDVCRNHPCSYYGCGCRQNEV